MRIRRSFRFNASCECNILLTTARLVPHSKTVKVTSVGDIVAETIQCISDVAPLGSITESHFEK